MIGEPDKFFVWESVFLYLQVNLKTDKKWKKQRKIH